MNLACRYLVFAVCGLGIWCMPAWGQELRRPASGPYDVVALMVEFQPDTSRFTTGDGTFGGDLYGGLLPKVDPLPHDKDYFQAHLNFLSDYVSRVSDGRVEIRSNLLPQVVRVSKPMSAYAPTGPDSDSDAELSKLAELVREAWAQAADPGIPTMIPGRTAFVIFHAGVGRDIELIGTTLDKTPQDLPSLFFDQAALTRHLGAASLEFAGIPIDNTLILPRTETRLGTDFIADEPFLLELSINGLLAASFFNFLGVPDLFDTEEGESAIGPFGLMDPQGIFAYRGLFPPEPMAWTKQYLGWTDPVVLEGDGPQTITLAAASLPGSSPSARAVVSGSEYFLVENRHRDPENDGLTLKVWQNGEIVEQHVENGDPEFNNFVVDGFIGGVVVGADNYDWALPGGLDDDNNELNGGILIWHIDERRLQAGLPTNSVNVGTESRAIDLEEADGAQDIGFPSGQFGTQAELGTPFDFWYRGNPVVAITQTGQEVRLYRNRFGPDTHPSSETSGGGPSFVVLEEFSEPGSVMSFTYDLTSIAGIDPVELDVPSPLGPPYGRGSGLASSDAGLAIYASNEAVFWGEGDAALWTWSGSFPSVVDGLAVLHKIPSGYPAVVVWKPAGEIFQAEHVIDLPEEYRTWSPISPIVYTNFERAARYNFLMRGEDSSVLIQAGTGGVEVTSDVREAVSLAAISTELGSTPVVVGRRGTSISGTDWSYDLGLDARVGQAVLGADRNGFVVAIPITNRGELWMLHPGGDVGKIDVGGAALAFGASTNDSLSAYPVLADFDLDGQLDVLVGYGSLLLAFSQSGAIVGNFPVRVPGVVAAQPLIARFAGQTAWTVFAAAADGYLYAYDTSVRQRLQPGFPLEVGNAAFATPLLHEGVLYAVSESGTTKAWRIPDIETVWWGKLYGSVDNASFVDLRPSGAVDQRPPPLIDFAETYNWPNPIQDGITHLRTRTGFDALVEITIIDAAGGLVAELEMNTRAGVPSEIAWEANVESGLYFARMTATSVDGAKATRLVKMAVIR